MEIGLVVIVVLLAVGAMVALLIALGVFPGGKGSQSNLRTMVNAQRASANRKEREANRQEHLDLLKNMPGQKTRKVSDSKLTLQRRLKYSQWAIPPVAFYLFMAGISLLSFSIASGCGLSTFARLGMLGLGPLIMNGILKISMMKRFKRFDKDYPQFLMSLVGLLKTGMTPLGALESAAKGLDDGSLVREECEVMLERLRFGVTEDKSIGAFGEDIYHPEIELFVQALLLSRRVGGTLSETLERLSRQVRKRQFFRSSAIAAVGMQRGSIWVIIGILMFIMGYMYIMAPELVKSGLNSEMGWKIWQGGILVICLGIIWVRKVTDIRV